MKIVLLCGGKGTRLREETEFRPKPMVPIGGKPILWHIMKTFGFHGFSDFVCCLGYRGEIIKDYFLNYESMNSDFTITLDRKKPIDYHGKPNERHFQVTLAETGADNNSGSRVKQIEKYVDDGDDIFMVTYGDGVADIDIPKLLAFHRSHGKLATVTTVNPASRFALIQFDESGKVVTYKEKPKMHSWISVGYFVFDKRVFDYLSDAPESMLEKEPLERLAQEGQLMAYKHDGFFYAMDTFRDFTFLNDLWNQSNAPWAVWDQERHGSSTLDVSL